MLMYALEMYEINV